ncbi:MAG: hypothetical protein QXS42_06270 [Zestosphaera sp.]
MGFKSLKRVVATLTVVQALSFTAVRKAVEGGYLVPHPGSA